MSETIEILRDAGIVAEDYSRGPLGNGIFAIAVIPKGPEGTIKFWPGIADVKTYPDAKYRQAVINSVEGNRKIERRINFRAINSYMTLPQQALQDFRAKVSLPLKTKCQVKDVQKNTDSSKDSGYIAMIEASTPYSNQTLLLGFDEKYHFICGLPESVKSVERAHEVLKPKGLRGDWIRQGEWFFVPVSQKIETKLEKIAMERPDRIVDRNLDWKPSNRRSYWGRNLLDNHFALQTIVENNNLFVKGYVYGGERINPLHHVGKFLEGWHRVIKNREIVAIIGGSTRVWD
jgi:hypothetical protein